MSNTDSTLHPLFDSSNSGRHAASRAAQEDVDMPTTIDVAGLHAALDAARTGLGWSWRQLARELGLSPSTMSRLGNGLKPDVDAFASMVSWLRVDPQQFILSDERNRSSVPVEPDLVAQLAPLLRARSDLDERDVNHLEALIRSAVQRFNSERPAGRN
jgi:transcriptional regulator with XRE-family HTH domain